MREGRKKGGKQRTHEGGEEGRKNERSGEAEGRKEEGIFFLRV